MIRWIVAGIFHNRAIHFKEGITVEKKFCGKCGNPIERCTCSSEFSGQNTGTTAFGTTSFGNQRSAIEKNNGQFFIRRMDDIALSQGETVVRKYHIGKFFNTAAALGGKGNACITITNKRVISKTDSRFFGTSSVSVEEMNIDSIVGIKNYYAQGFTIWRLALAIIFAVFALASFSEMVSSGVGRYGENLGTFLMTLILAVLMGATCRKPSYLFGLYSSAAAPTMQMGANLRGKILNSNGYGIVFQYKPTKEAIKLMCEMGACIMDIKTKGDYAVEVWRQA